MLRSAMPIGRIAGIKIYVHWSLVVTLTLMAWLLASNVLPSQSSDASAALNWLTGIATAAALLLSLLAHELAHSIVAKRSGVRVDRVTLWLLGGVSELLDEPPNPKADLRIAAAGPITSFAIGLAALGTAGSLTSFASPLLITAIAWLGATNIVLGMFNLLPGAPLDGGRVLRAILWRRSGDRLKAATSAARSGRAVGLALVIVGIAETLALGSAGGLWLMLLGWFLRNSANAELADASTRHQLGDIRIRDAMTASPVALLADSTVQDALDTVIRHSHHRVFPVIDPAGRPLAVVALSDLTRVPTRDRGNVSISSVVDGNELLATTAARAILRPGVDLIAVLDNGRLAGIVTSTDLIRACDRSALGLPVHGHEVRK